MEDLDKDCEVDDDYSSTKEMNGKVSWIIDKGIWLGKKAVITGAVISSAPLVLPPLVVFSTLGLACSVPFGFVFATYACTQKIMSKLLPTPESGSVLEYGKDDMEVIHLVQGAGSEEEGFYLEDVDLVQGAAEQENDELLQQVDEQGYVEEGDDLVQRAEEQGYEEDEEEVDLEQAREEQKMKDAPAEVKERDILQEKPVDTIGFGVTSTEQNDELLQHMDEQGYVEEGNDLVQRAEEQGYEEDEEEEVDLEKAPEEQKMKDAPAEVKERDILQEKPVDTIGFGVTTTEQNDELLQQMDEQGYVEEGNDWVPREEEQGYEEDEEEEFDLEQAPEEQEMKDTPAEVKERNNLQEKPIDVIGFGVTTTEQSDELLQRRDEQGYVEEGDDLVKREEEQGYEEDEEEEFDLEQAPEEQEMKDTPAEVKERDILQEKPIDMIGFGVTTTEQNDELLQRMDEQGYVEEGNDLVQRAEDQGYEEDEEEEVDIEQAPVEQKMKDAPAEVEERDILQEKPIDIMGFGVTTTEQKGRNDVLPEGAALSQEDVLYGQDDMQIYKEEPVEQEKLMLEVDDAITSMDIHKQKPAVEEKQSKQVVEGAATILELDVNDISEPERGHSYQALVYDGKNDFAVLKKESDEMKRDILMRNNMDGEAKNETREGSASQANEIFVSKSLEERPTKIVEHSHEGEYMEDTTKYIQLNDVLSVESAEVRNEKPIIEDMNEKRIIGMRQVIVSVHGGKKIVGEQENQDRKECNKSQKLVLVAKKVTDETVGDKKSVVERTMASDLNSARDIADECGQDLFDYTAGDHHSYNDFNISQENDNTSSKTGGVADLPSLRISTRVAVSKHINLQPETDTVTPSKEELLNEEKIWEQIDALRAIVGYSAPMHASSVEEIKALYIFTGVEPPPSLVDSSDLAEMNEKLQLLKSVVGVK